MKMKHPDSKQTVEVDPSRADMYASQGWEPVAEAPKDSKKS